MCCHYINWAFTVAATESVVCKVKLCIFMLQLLYYMHHFVSVT